VFDKLSEGHKRLDSRCSVPQRSLGDRMRSRGRWHSRSERQSFCSARPGGRIGCSIRQVLSLPCRGGINLLEPSCVRLKKLYSVPHAPLGCPNDSNDSGFSAKAIKSLRQSSGCSRRSDCTAQIHGLEFVAFRYFTPGAARLGKFNRLKTTDPERMRVPWPGPTARFKGRIIDAGRVVTCRDYIT